MSILLHLGRALVPPDYYASGRQDLGAVLRVTDYDGWLAVSVDPDDRDDKPGHITTYLSPEIVQKIVEYTLNKIETTAKAASNG